MPTPPSSLARPTVALILEERHLDDHHTRAVSAALEAADCRLPVVVVGGSRPVPHVDISAWDACLVRAEGHQALGLAAAVEACHVPAVNPYCATMRARNPVAARSILEHHGYPVTPDGPLTGEATAHVVLARFGVADGRRRRPAPPIVQVAGVGAHVVMSSEAASASVRRLAIACARALGLEAWSLGFTVGPDGPVAAVVDDDPGFEDVPGGAEAVAGHLLDLARRTIASRSLREAGGLFSGAPGA